MSVYSKLKCARSGVVAQWQNNCLLWGPLRTLARSEKARWDEHPQCMLCVGGEWGHPRACSAGDEGGTTDILVRALAGGGGMMDIHGACSVGPWLMVEGQSFLWHHFINKVYVRRKGPRGGAHGHALLHFFFYYGWLCLCKIPACSRTYLTVV